MNGMWILFAVFLVAALDAVMAAKLSQSVAAAQLAASGITTSSSGGCTNRQQGSCTSLDQINDNTVNCMKALKAASGCALVITGGTEVGHSTSTYSHYNGYKIDIPLTSCINSFITSKYTSIGARGDGAAQYKQSNGNIYAKEGNHWDITFTGAC